MLQHAYISPPAQQGSLVRSSNGIFEISFRRIIAVFLSVTEQWLYGFVIFLLRRKSLLSESLKNRKLGHRALFLLVISHFEIKYWT